ncbi:penicillin acylase family protein [Trinickia sp.]|uniref:penicillin acylase family protein n=1 Tax=Trinickia sp. TaxID=2571163 RepID=UPI003F7CEE17
MKARPRRRRRLRLLALCAISVLTLSVLALIAGLSALALSMPALDGAQRGTGLRASVEIARDAHGVATLSGATREDVAYATGFVHAQERFFQMDLLRRSAAGTLAALVGSVALPVDRQRRIFGFQALADNALAHLSLADRALLDRYTAGVNAGLAALRVRPFEYLVLRARPVAWRAQDSLLVIWSMYFELQGNVLHREFARGWLREHTDSSALKALLPECSEWDAPLDARSVACDDEPLRASAPDWLGKASSQTLAQLPFGTAVGSNAWALAGTRTSDGSAIVSNDMHLNLRLPNIWYRVALEYPSPSAGMRRIVGVTLPGTPAVVAGSNGSVAWGLTNSYGDYLDLVELRSDANHPGQYRTSHGWLPIRFHNERLQVNGGAAETVRVGDTDFGPVWDVGARRYAVRWVARDEGAVNLDLLHMETAANVEQALTIARSTGIPAQNLIAGDAAGHIGWTIAGAMPNRHPSWDDTFPQRSDAMVQPSHSLLAADAHPTLLDSASGQLWSANARQLAGSGNDLIGDGGADLGARARQIRDDLAGRPMFDEKSAYAPSLDDRALFMSTWRDRALRVLDDQAVAGRPQRGEFRRLLRDGWNGCACVDSVSYRLTRDFLFSLYGELFSQADQDMQKLDPSASVAQASSRWPVVLARLVDQQPPAWLPGNRKNWRDVQLAAVDDTIADLTRRSIALKDAAWGQRNTARIAHPFVAGFPFLSHWLAAPPDRLPGDGNMPRVATPTFGQSERMVISPGHEERGIFNMPGGQSGHPMSSSFLDEHRAWVLGKATALLPGPPVHRLVLAPS